MIDNSAWARFQASLFADPAGGLMLDLHGMDLSDAVQTEMGPMLDAALDDMAQLEAGAIANPDEGRMVGHYWLRAPALAPTAALRQEIEDCLSAVKRFAAEVHEGRVRAPGGKPYKNVLVAGIGGSSLGPLFVDQALRGPGDRLRLWFLDNTDPDGMDAVFRDLGDSLGETLTVVISKSGGTIETRNCLEEARAAYAAAGLDFCRNAVCVSGEGSRLWQRAEAEGWLRRFPMWDWVGGRTSVMSAVGLVPLALKGVDVDAFLRGAADCDALGRSRELWHNPAALLALSWYRCTGGRGGQTMVVLPYRDSLSLFAKYLQQLVMESLGKELDKDGNTVKQGLAVLGNKGSSDQHSYVQQLVGGPDNVFVVFVQVLKDRLGPSPVVGEDSTSGDYLNAFLLGTQKALASHGKRSLTITVPTVDAYRVGQLIALFERAVGLYASMVRINAYHQPAVEFGKKAADGLIRLKNALLAALPSFGEGMDAPALAEAAGGEAADVFRLLLHLSANGQAKMEPRQPVTESRFWRVSSK